MKKRYFLKTFSGILLAFILFASGNLLAQNRKYLGFDGTNDYVKYSDDDTLGKMDGASDYTIEAWVYPFSTADGYDRVLQRYNSFSIQLYDGNNDGTVADWYFYVYDGSNHYFNTQGDATLTVGAWNHIAVVCNSTSGTLKLFVNGNDVTQTGGYSNLSLPGSSSGDNLYIGQKGNGNSFFDGYIDEVRLKNAAEDPANLHFHPYDNQYTSDANTAVLFHFNEGSGSSTVNEASGTNATLYNSPGRINWDAHQHLPLAHEWIGTTTDWATTGNWYGDVPTAANDVIIPNVTNDPLIGTSTTATCNNLEIESSAVLSIGGNLTVSGTLTNNAGTSGLILNSTATEQGSLIHSTASVDGTVERQITQYSGNDDGWHLLSSPVNNFTIASSDFAPTSGDDDLFRWDETNDNWNNYDQGGFTTFTNGMGYLCAYKATATKDFDGQLNVSDVPFSNLSLDNYGWHLLGNPFSSAVIWNSSTASWNLTAVNATAKIWKESTASYSDIAADAPIPSTQGFMVQVSNATNSLTIPAAAREHNAQDWYKSSKTNKIKLTVYDTEGNTAQESIVRIAEGSTAGFDTQYDSHFLKGYAPQFYSVVGQEKLSTNTIPDVSAMETIPFDFIKNASDTYYIEAEGIEDLVPEQDVYLTDLKTNYTQKLNDNPVYYFTAQEGDEAQRFELHFSALGINQMNTVKQFNIYGSSNQIVVRANKPANAVVNVYNVTGQLIAKAQLAGQTFKTISLNGFTGIAIVSVVSSKGTQNQKVIIR